MTEFAEKWQKRVTKKKTTMIPSSPQYKFPSSKIKRIINKVFVGNERGIPGKTQKEVDQDQERLNTLNQGDFIIMRWFSEDDVAEIRFVYHNPSGLKEKIYSVLLLPVRNGKRIYKGYNDYVLSPDILDQRVMHIDHGDIKRMATIEEISTIKQIFPFWKTKGIQVSTQPR